MSKKRDWYLFNSDTGIAVSKAPVATTYVDMTKKDVAQALVDDANQQVAKDSELYLKYDFTYDEIDDCICLCGYNDKGIYKMLTSFYLGTFED